MSLSALSISTAQTTRATADAHISTPPSPPGASTTNKSRSAEAQTSAEDALSRLIWDMFQMHQSKTVCVVDTTRLSSVRESVLRHLRVSDGQTVTTQQVATAIWELYPCPFSPDRPQLRLAMGHDIDGAWVFPARSQKLRYGPKSPEKPPMGNFPVSCDVIGYYPDGEVRHVISAGPAPCPFKKSMDLDAVRTLPRVASWAWERDGRIRISRTDVANHIEEWDVYVVLAPFSVYGVDFLAGDLLAFNRRSQGNEVGATTEFRHWQKLPNDNKGP